MKYCYFLNIDNQLLIEINTTDNFVESKELCDGDAHAVIAYCLVDIHAQDPVQLSLHPETIRWGAEKDLPARPVGPLPRLKPKHSTRAGGGLQALHKQPKEEECPLQLQTTPEGPAQVWSGTAGVGINYITY